MTDIPRRAPLTGEERARNARNALGAMIAAGATGDARVVQERGGAQPFMVGAAVAGNPDRLSAYLHVDYATLNAAGGAYNVDAWDGAVEVGGAVQLASPDDGGVYLLGRGLYAATLFLAPHGLDSAPSSCCILGSVVGGGFPNIATCVARGGDPNGTISAYDATASMIWFADGSPGTGFRVFIRTANLDPAMYSLGINLDVVQIAGA